jgi:alpha-beta hydrolase superfamily lysophospholipase
MYIAFAAVATSYAGICLAMFVFQRSLLYYPQPRAVTAAESTLALPVPGAELVVTVRPHSGPKAIIYFGGNGEDVSANLEGFSHSFPDHALFLLHYRGYGGSTGHPSEQAINSDAIALFRNVYAMHTEVAVIGRSLGSGVAIRLASETPASRLILVTPFDSIEEIAAAAYPYVPVRLLLLDRYESWKYAPDIAIPTTLIAAQNDEVIPRASNDIGAKSEYLEVIQAALR